MTWLNHRILALIEEIIHTSQDCDAVRTGERWDAATPSQPIALLQVNRSQEKHEPVGTNVNVLTSRNRFFTSPRHGFKIDATHNTARRLWKNDRIRSASTPSNSHARSCRRLMWSCTEMPSGVAIWTIALVIWMSACDGVG